MKTVKIEKLIEYFGEEETNNFLLTYKDFINFEKEKGVETRGRKCYRKYKLYHNKKFIKLFDEYHTLLKYIKENYKIKLIFNQ